MKYILIMQLILDIYKGGGASINTVRFEDKASCEKVKAIFMETLKETRPMYDARIYRKAECVQIDTKEENK